MTALEDELRASLARQADGGSAARCDHAELAEQVIRLARRSRRRQRLAGLSAITSVVLLIGLVPIYLAGRHPAPPAAPVAAAPSTRALLTPAAELPTAVTGDVSGQSGGKARAVSKLPVDVVAGDQLVTADGSSIDVSFAGEVSQAYRVAEGWLVVGVPEAAVRSSVWLVWAAGGRKQLLAGVTGVAFDPASSQVAWRAGARVFLGRVDGGRLSTQSRSEPVAGSATPVGFVADAVLLARGRDDGYDLWWPKPGVYQAAWARTAVTVYGGLADGRTAVGQVLADPAAAAAGGLVAGERRCLALFGLDSQAEEETGGETPDEIPVKTACGLGLAGRSPGWVSPDGRWLLTGAGSRTVLVDLAQLGAKPRVLSQGLPTAGGVAWLDEQTVVLTASSGRAVMRLRLDELRDRQVGSAQQWSIPVVTEEAVLLVPRLNS